MLTYSLAVIETFLLQNDREKTLSYAKTIEEKTRDSSS